MDSDRRGVLARIGSFSVAPLLNLLTPFLVLPILARATDTAEWAAIGVGQSIGALAGGVLAFGWPLTGSVEIARGRDVLEQRLTYTESLISRGLLLPPVLALCGALALASAPSGELFLTAATAAAGATVGMTANWVAVGLGRARHILLLEAAPRLLLMISAAGFIGVGGSVLAYPAALAGSSVVAAVLFSSVALRPIRVRDWVPLALTRLRRLAPAAAGAIVASLYSAGALLLVGIAASVTATAVIASADRLYRIGVLAVAVLANALQAWVVQDEGAGTRRLAVALRMHAALGVLGAIAFGSLVPTISAALFGEDVAPGYDVAFLYGATFACLSLGTSLAQHVMVPAGQLRSLFWCALTGAAVGVPGILILAGRFQSLGAAGGLLLSELAVLAAQIWFISRSRIARVR